MTRRRSGGWAYGAGLVALAAGAVVATLLDAPQGWQLAPLGAGLLVTQLTAASRRHARCRWHPRALREVQPWLTGGVVLIAALMPDRVTALVLAIYIWALECVARSMVARAARRASSPHPRVAGVG